MKKILLGVAIGFILTLLVNILSLQVVNIEETEAGALITIKTLCFNSSYYYEK